MLGCRFSAYISSLSYLHVVKTTANTVMIGDISVSREELQRRHTSPEISDATLVYGLLMGCIAGNSIGEFRMQKDMPPSTAWEELPKYDMPETLATTQRY